MYKKRNVSSQEYKGCTATVNNGDVGLLCSWFLPLGDSASVFQICSSKNTAHKYIPISCYLCSIPGDSLQVVHTSSCQRKSLMQSTSSHKKIAIALKIRLSKECQAFIADCLSVRLSAMHGAMIPTNLDHTVIDLDFEEGNDELSLLSSTKWLMVGNIILYESDKATLLDDKEWINDNHIASAQILLKLQFTQLGGLDFTLKQENGSLNILSPNSLQVIYINGNHWAVVSTVHCK